MLPLETATVAASIGMGDDGDHRSRKQLSFARALDLRAAIENEPPKLQFVLHGLMRRYSAGIIALGSTGKSFLNIGIGCEVATGGLYSESGLVGQSMEPGKVLYLSAEEDDTVLQHRLHAIGSHLSPVQRELVYQNFDVRSSLGTTPALVSRKLEVNESAILELIDSLKGYVLVMIDPLRKWHDGDENQSADMTVLTKVFDRIALGADCALLFSHHSNKNANRNGSGDEAAASRGSSAITDNIRLQINLSKLDEKDLREHDLGKNDANWFVAMDFSKMNHAAPEGTRILRRRPDGTLHRDAAVEQARGIERVSKVLGRSSRRRDMPECEDAS